MEIHEIEGQDQPDEHEATTTNASQPSKPGSGDVNYFFPTKKSDDMKILEAYISQPSGDLSDLKGFPVIHKLFRKFNTLMPSSASVEVC